MAQTFPTSAQVIYDTLVADASFMALVGTYNFTDGSTFPSISIKSPGEDLPELNTVAGLEVVVMDAGDVRQQAYVSDTPDAVFTWTVFLIVWDPEKAQKITDAVKIMSSKFLGLTSIDTLASSDGAGALTQTKVFIMSNMPIIG